MKHSVFRFLCLFLLCSFYSSGQNNLQGSVRNSQTKEAIPYCAISVKNTNRGCLTNEEGLFVIRANVETDTLLVQYIGYKKQMIPVKDFVKDPIIYIQSKETSFNEVVVYSTNDYFYDLFDKCREKLIQAKQLQSKAYFVLETELAKQPVELLECYYNSTWNNSAVKEITFKNGRVGIASYKERFFMSQNISKAFTFLNLTTPVTYLPSIPFQFSKRKLKKHFKLSLKEITDKENPLYHLQFMPVDTSGSFFSGEAWIEKNSGELKKLTLKIYNTTKHPFLPLNKDFGEIKDVSMQISKTFMNQDGQNVLTHIDFNYQLNYQHYHSLTLLNTNKDTAFQVNSKGLMYFYDYHKPFIPPYFVYDAELSDYRKISALTFNESFWKNNNSLVYSEKMKKGINYFRVNGQLLNYKSRSINKAAFGKKEIPIFENNYIEWSEKKRVSLKKDKLINDTASNNQVNNQAFMANRYNLKAQIFLDLNEVDNVIQHHSQSVFDVYQTYYNISEEPATNCFINIYFDLVEIHRQQMEKQIAGNKLTLEQFEALYKQTNKQLEEDAALYFKEVERGKNLKALEKWNELIYKTLEINNFEMFQIGKK